MSASKRRRLVFYTDPEGRTKRIDIRVTPREYELFKQAAALAGDDLSSWVRARMRLCVEKEFQHARLPAPKF